MSPYSGVLQRIEQFLGDSFAHICSTSRPFVQTQDAERSEEPLRRLRAGRWPAPKRYVTGVPGSIVGSTVGVSVVVGSTVAVGAVVAVSVAAGGAVGVSVGVGH